MTQPDRSPGTRPSDTSPALDSLPDGHPTHLGPYKLLQVIGEGGMGVVYEAQQVEPVSRRVALKVIKLGMDTREVIARFEAERQALAVMDHPGIARVLDAGASETGRPYFVMELVKGIPLTEYCNLHKLSTEERLHLFIKLCHAVQHAHQKGVIHRDLKPSNVLVTLQDGVPHPKVIDFGIAKAIGQRLTQRTLVTQHGQAVGTPAYMSPEQLEMSGLDVDTRTDIYALGVILYELVAGTLPYDFEEMGTPEAMPHFVRERETPTPSSRLSRLGDRQTSIAKDRHTDPKSLLQVLKGDLDWIVLKSMEKDRTRRYETANGLALELERYLRNEPVRARPPSRTYRFLKFVRRNRAGAAAVAVATLALVVGALTASVGMVRALRAERMARDEATVAKQVSDFLVGLFEVSRPSEARGNSITAREILDRGAQSLRQELADQPAVQARMLETIGRVYRSLGLYNDAIPLLERSLAIREAQSPPNELEVAESHHALGVAYRLQGRLDDADEHFAEAMRIRETLLGPDHLDVASTAAQWGAIYMGRAQYQEAEQLFLRALHIRERQLAPDDPLLATANNDVGANYWSWNKVAEAEPYLRRALDIRERTAEPDDPSLARSLNNMGALYWTLGNYQSALPLYERAYDIWLRVLGPDHPSVSSVMNNLAETYWALGRLDEAESFFRRSLEIKERTLTPSNTSIAVTLNGLANVYRDEGRTAEAEPLYRRALEIRETQLGPEHHLVRETLTDYAKLLRADGRVEEAEPLEARAKSIADKQEGG